MKRLGLIALLFILTVNAVYAAGPSVSIRNFEVHSSRTDDVINPGERVEVKFYVKNNGNSTIEDLDIEMTIEDEGGSELESIEGRDLIFYDSIKTLVKGEEESIRLEFIFPYNFDPAEKYFVRVIVEGEDVNNNDVDAEDEHALDIERRKYEIAWPGLNLEPAETECGDYTTLSYTVKNIGKDSEEGVIVHVNIPEIGYAYASRSFTIDNEPDQDVSEYSEVVRINVPEDAKKGNYDVNIYAQLRNNVRKQARPPLLTVTCGNKATEKPVAIIPEEEPEEETSAETTEPQPIQPEEKTAEDNTVEGNKKDNKVLIISLIIAAQVILIIGIVAIIMIKNRRGY